MHRIIRWCEQPLARQIISLPPAWEGAIPRYCGEDTNVDASDRRDDSEAVDQFILSEIPLVDI